MLENYPDVLTSRDIMEILNIDKSLLYELLQSRQIPAYRIGNKKWRVNKDSFIEYLKRLESCGGGE